MTEQTINPVNAYIGNRIRQARLMRDLSQIKQLEEQRILTEEKIQKCGAVDDRLVKINRTSWEFLGNPHDYWVSSPIERKRLVLKATFARPLAYHRNEGYRTPALSLPFLVLKEFSSQKEVMVVCVVCR
jgi:site-specific DNA recombinase